MIKNRRHKIIKEIIEKKDIETQVQLTEELEKYGFNVTQATISRDIKELGLVKVSAGENSFRYSFPSGIVSGNSLERTKKMLQDNLLRMDHSYNMIIMKTLPGTAQGIAFCLDSLSWKDVLGTVAGDDTILIIVRENINVNEVMQNLQKLTQ